MLIEKRTHPGDATTRVHTRAGAHGSVRGSYLRDRTLRRESYQESQGGQVQEEGNGQFVKFNQEALSGIADYIFR